MTNRTWRIKHINDQEMSASQEWLCLCSIISTLQELICMHSNMCQLLKCIFPRTPRCQLHISAFVSAPRCQLLKSTFECTPRCQLLKSHLHSLQDTSFSRAQNACAHCSSPPLGCQCFLVFVRDQLQLC